MTPLEQIFKLVTKKLKQEPDSLLPMTLVKALIELEEEGMKACKMCRPHDFDRHWFR